MMEEVIEQLQTGYKVSGLGGIPFEWEVIEQGNIAKFLNGRAYKQTEFKESGMQVVRIQNLTGGENYVFSNLELDENKYIDNNDLIYAWSATFGPYIWKGPKSIYHYHIWKVEVNSEVLNKLFFYYRLDYISSEMHSQKNGSAFSHITKAGMEKHKILLPPLKEQQKIAEILSTVDEQIENTEQLIQKTKELKKGLMQQLLTKGIGHTEFKQTELGDIPVEWEIKMLGEIGDFRKGKGIAKMDLTIDGYPCILYGELYTKYSETISAIISKTNIDPKKSVEGYCNDVLIPSSGETAYDIACASSLLVDKVLIGGDTNIFRPIKDINGAFLSYSINSVFKDRLSKLAQGSSVYHLYSDPLSKFSVILPPLEEQQKIVEILTTVDEQIVSYEKEKEKQFELKKGLMQQLLTGKLRVTV